MITLTFRPLRGETATLARGAYFRICADDTLRGPDNMVAANYLERRWQLGQRRYQAFDSSGPIVLRVTDHDGHQERMGPFDFVRAADGAIFTHQGCLGTHSQEHVLETSSFRWREIALLSPEATA